MREEAESLLSIFVEERPKVKDLDNSSHSCTRQTVSRSHDQRLLLVNVGTSGLPPDPPVPGSVSARDCSLHSAAYVQNVSGGLKK